MNENLKINLELNKPSQVTCKLFGVDGVLVCNVLNYEWWDVGSHTYSNGDYSILSIMKGMYILVFCVNGNIVFNQLLLKN